MTRADEQALADALTTALPLLDHLRETAAQQVADIEQLRRSLMMAAALLKPH